MASKEALLRNNCGFLVWGKPFVLGAFRKFRP